MSAPGRYGKSTADDIASHAAERPGAVALINGAQTVSFGQFHRDIGKFAAALRGLGLPRGSTVAIGCTDVYVHWLLLLAFERLNITTASFDHMESPSTYEALLAGVDLVMRDANFPIAATAARHHSIADAWVRETLAREGDSVEPDSHAPGDLVRILRSSGSTGRPKRLAITRHMLEWRIIRCGARYEFTQNSRYMPGLPFSVGHIYYAATACLRAGGSVIDVPTTRGGARVFAEQAITHVSAQPLKLKQILDDLPPDFVKPPGLAVFTFGSPTSDELGRRALDRLATEVTECFGCNEVGFISGRQISRGDSFATVAPGTEVEVVDDADRPLPWGEPGRLRIKSECMVAGYLDDPETTRRFFEDGWFYPSDLAILDGPRRLKILGRSDDVINIVGGKMAPGDLEALVAKHPGVGDVGICTLANSEGIQEIYIAVSNVRVDQRELLGYIERALAAVPLGRFHVVILKAIPRNPAGKIQRAELRAAVAAFVERRRR